MERKEFIKSCGYVCLGSFFLSTMLTSCAGARFVNGAISGSDLVIPVSTFHKPDNTFSQYIVVQNDNLEFPICLYRFSKEDYAALYMKCPHQGAELQVFGDRLQCPAHGSEFNNKGIVQNGPADTNLRIFPVSIENEQIKISLK